MNVTLGEGRPVVEPAATTGVWSDLIGQERVVGTLQRAVHAAARAAVTP